MKLYSKDGQLRALLTENQFEQLKKYGSWGPHPLGRNYRVFNINSMSEGGFVSFSFNAGYGDHCKMYIQYNDYITRDENNDV